MAPNEIKKAMKTGVKQFFKKTKKQMRQDGGDISKIILILSFVLVPALICFLKGFTEIIKVESNRMMSDCMEQDSCTYRPWVPNRVRKSLVRVFEYG